MRRLFIEIKGPETLTPRERQLIVAWARSYFLASFNPASMVFSVALDREETREEAEQGIERARDEAADEVRRAFVESFPDVEVVVSLRE